MSAAWSNFDATKARMIRIGAIEIIV